MNGVGILIIDDEPGIRRTLASILEDERYRVYTSEDAITGKELLSRENVSLVFLDVLLPRLGGLEALEQIRREFPHVEVVMISGHANVDMAVRAVKLGAFDFLEKPISLDKVLTVCRNALAIKDLKEENLNLKKNSGVSASMDDILGTSDEIEKIRALISQTADSDARILITGENGTGKEIVARAIHRLSGRREKPFVEVNCAAIPETLIESELFGHEKGAFTDAYSSRRGRFETASGGTLFLDEIGDMSLTAQAKVLRAIQEQKIERVGGENTIDVDVRILAATNQDLEQASNEGRFRSDLFFRLNVIPIKIPPLRERKSDIPLLLYHFFSQFSRAKIEIDKPGFELLTSYSWPGNIRELKNFAERLAVMYTEEKVGEKIVSDLLKIKTKEHDFETANKKNSEAAPETSLLQNSSGTLLKSGFNDAKESFERLYLEFHLSRNNGIISRTAEAIGIYPSNLHAKLRKYGIKFSGKE